MNVFAYMIPGVIVALGVMGIVAAVRPRRPRLSSALERLGTTTTSEPTGGMDVESRVGGWVQRRLPDLPGFTIPRKELALIGIPVNKYLFDKVVRAIFGFLILNVAGVLFQLIAGIPYFIPAAIGIPLAVLGWISVDQDVRSKAKEARAEFARSVAVYLELVAAERRRGAPPAFALMSAAEIGKSWVFVRIREELTRATYDGTPAWDALTEYSEELNVPELADVGHIIRLSGEQGASVYETLRARGKSLRVQLLNEEHTQANEASERMTVPMTTLALVFVGIILTPLVMNLFST